MLQSCFTIRDRNQNENNTLLLANLSVCHKSQLVESARPSISSICEGEQHQTSNGIEASSEPEDSEPVPSGGHSTQTIIKTPFVIHREGYITVLVIPMRIPVTSVDVLVHEVRQWTSQTRVLDIVMLRDNKIIKVEKFNI